MKVAICAPMDLTVAGGVETHIRQLARALRRLGVELDVFATSPDGEARPWSRLQAGAYQIIHTHAGLFHRNFLGMALNRRAGQRHVHTLHGVSIDYLRACRTWGNWRCYTSTFLEGLLSRYADHVICVSAAVKRRARQCFGIDPDRITVIGNGHIRRQNSLEKRRRIRQGFNISDDTALVLFVGRGQDRVKGAAALTEALKALQGSSSVPVRLLAIPGDGFADEPWLVRCGRVAHDQIGDFYAAADIFVNASLNEGLPLTLIEAMAAGLPIVAAPVGGIPELITHRRNGLLLRPDRGDLAGQLRHLIQDPGLRRRLGQTARRDARKLTWDHIARQTLKVYERLLSPGV
ncbi:MAG: glycosyltransferase family 4 protein [Sedimentisphaerales bacterium]|nr:glycosyltransferase family 4 protein [Sedimentisphaerales bacterium]